MFFHNYFTLLSWQPRSIHNTGWVGLVCWNDREGGLFVRASVCLDYSSRAAFPCVIVSAAYCHSSTGTEVNDIHSPIDVFFII